MGRTPNMIYNMLLADAKIEYQRAKNDPENPLIRAYKDNEGCYAMFEQDVLIAFYSEGYGLDKAKIHLKDWYELGIAGKRRYLGSDKHAYEVIVFAGM